MKIGLLGAGTIGFGVVEIADRTEGLEIVKILDRRQIPELAGRLTADPSEILADPSVDTVTELLGGVEPAFTWVKQALLAGKNVVTANKLLVSSRLDELLDAAEKGGAQLRFSAAVGGGIPFLFNLLRARRTDEVKEIGGILNGTTNYILTRMQEENAAYETVLKEAQRLGYAEADPTADVSGLDTACKITLASCIAWNGRLKREDVLREGIEHITERDAAAAAAAGGVLKLLARAVQTGDGLCVTVEPTLVKAGSVTAGIRLVENMACWTGKNAGPQRFTGAGAGRYATAGAVVNDLLDLETDGIYPFSIANRPLTARNDLPRRYLTRGLELPGEKMGGHLLTDPVAPSAVHAAASSARAEGREVFFAAIEE